MQQAASVDTNGLTTILITAIAATPPTILALAAFIAARRTNAKVETLHIDVNSRLTELVESTRVAAQAGGELKGAADERDRKRKE